MPYNATPQQVQTALAGLASIGSGHVTVNGPSAGQVGATGVDLYTVTFTDLLGGEAGLPAITIQSQGLADSLGQTSDVQTESWIVAPPAQASGAMQQVVVTAPVGGTFDLSFKGDATGALAQGISASQLQTALAGLGSVGNGNVLVTGSGTALDPYLISFVGTLAGQELPALQVVGTPTTVNTVTTNYDAASQTTSVGDNFSHYAYAYDGQGNVATVDNTGTSGGGSVVLTSQYDSLGNRTSLAASIGGTADFINNYSYDALSRLTQLTQQSQTGGNAVAPKGLQFTYDPPGDLKTIQRYTNLTSGPNSATDPADSTLGYNTLGQLTSIAHSHNASPLDNLSWTYDALGRVATFTSSVDGTATYGYDLTNQVTSATYTTNPGAHQPANESYGYDANGNRTSSGTATVTSAPPNEVASDGTFNYTYDAEGNRITKTGIAGGSASGQSTTYSWDYRNRLTEVESFNSGTLTQAVAYSYDVFDHMIEREVDSTGAVDASGAPVFSLVQNFVYDGNDIALEFDNGSLAHRYLSAPGANGVDAVMAEEAVSSTSSPGTVTWPLVDNLGSVRDVVDSTGAVIDHLVYNSFGQVAYESNAGTHHLQGYAGGLADAATGLVNFWHRWYDSATGNWLSQDPSQFAAGDTNLTRYIKNSPSNGADPSGLYGPGGHFWTVYLVAMATGCYSKTQAYELAYYAQLPDQDPLFDARTLGEKYGYGTTRPMTVDPDSDWARDIYNWIHSLHGGDADAVRQRRALLVNMIQGNVCELATWERGMLLHALGDSFAHTQKIPNKAGLAIEGEAWAFPVGHGWEQHAPDLIANDLEKYKQYVNTLFKALGGKGDCSDNNDIVKLFKYVEKIPASIESESFNMYLYARSFQNGKDKAYTFPYIPGSFNKDTNIYNPDRNAVFGLMSKIEAAEDAQQDADGN